MNKPHFLLALLGTVASVAPHWTSAQTQGRGYPTASSRGTRLSGTYELDPRTSDNPRTVVARASQSLPADRRERTAENWIRRLDAPATIVIDVNGRTVSLMSSNAPELTFEATGLDRTENGTNGRPVTTNAALRGNRLVVSTAGNRGSDFTVTFQPVANGLRVTRRLDSDVQQTSVTAQSFYRRVSEPRWDVYTGSTHTGSTYTGSTYSGSRAAVRSGALVPDGTRLHARLDSALNADEALAGRRVTLTVQNPGPYMNAVIDGVVTRTGSTMGIDFGNIRLSNGRTAVFDAVIDTVRTPNGKAVRLGDSGVVAERSRWTSGTLEKGAIGAGIGAIIGAIAGGKKGAVIGAVAGGAGMILVDTKTDQKLPAGTAFTISTIAR